VASASADFKAYQERIGPGRGHPERPIDCPFCEGLRVWFDGWRWVFAVVLQDGSPLRFDDGLPLQRAVCSRCHHSWTLRPAFLYPHRALQPDVVQAAAVKYLAEEDGTYRRVAACFRCSARSVWRWVGWLAGLLAAPQLLAEAEQLCATGLSAGLIPRSVPQDHAKAYSPERAKVLLAAFQGLAALALWSRAQPVPPTDPSPLRFWLNGRFLAFRQIERLVGSHQSPPMPVEETGPPRLDRRR